MQLIKIITFSIFFFPSFSSTTNSKLTVADDKIIATSVSKKIQVAILLDVSNSMDGLIEQAKAQLWNMVTVLGKAECDGYKPSIEIALYEYGRTSNEHHRGYVKEISAFTSDLDQLSQHLFKLTTHGGKEYCGNAIYNSVNELKWDTSSVNYKVIFIAGNEDFLQGNIPYIKACNAAMNKGIIVNTIYCGNKLQGIAEHWNLGSECGGGSFTNIDQDAIIEEIATPYDSTILTLNKRLNSTYIAYGSNGYELSAQQASVDEMNLKMNKSVAVKRASVKSNKSLYSNTHWDMVDAAEKDDKFFKKLERKTLPDSLKNKNDDELKQIVAVKKEERMAIQKEIAFLATERTNFIASEKKKNVKEEHKETLETQIELIIKKQAAGFNFLFKN